MMVVDLKRGYIKFVKLNAQMRDYLHDFYEDDLKETDSGDLIIEGKASELYHILIHPARTFDIEIKQTYLFNISFTFNPLHSPI